jgi:hypothetical protein
MIPLESEIILLPKSPKIIAFGPSLVDNGVISRVIEMPDGSAHVETLTRNGWVKGGASFDEFFMARPPPSWAWNDPEEAIDRFSFRAMDALIAAKKRPR